MKIKTTVRCHYTPVQWLKLKRLTLSRVDQAVGALELLHIAWGNVKWYNVFQKHLGSLLKSYTHTTHAQLNISSHSTSRNLSKINETYVHTKTEHNCS